MKKAANIILCITLLYVIGFFYPVVPKEKARIRVQLSAAHTKEQLDKAINAFVKVGKKLEII